MIEAFFATGPIVRGAVLSLVGLAWAIAIVRLLGLRALSKMTAFDFLITLATASLLATAAAATTPDAAAQPLVAMGVLAVLQFALSLARRHDPVRRVLENEPLLLIHDGRVLERALRRSRVTRADLLAKLRREGITDVADVSAAVLETTGDVSVVHGGTPSAALIADVRHTGG